MHAWLRQAADALARATGTPRERLELSSDDIQTLLEGAGHAAHASGARTNAPLLCYLLGIAAATSGRTPEELSRVVESAEANTPVPDSHSARLR